MSGTRGPVLVGIPITDYCGAMLVVQGAMLGLYSRTVTGRGQHVEIPMLGGLLFGLTTRVGPYFATGDDPVRWGSQHSQVVPYRAFETKDGYAVAGVWGDDGWVAFCDALDWPELVSDERFDTNIKRVERRDQLGPMLEERFRARPTGEWEQCFAERGVLFAPVNTFSEVLRHPQVEAMNFVETIEHPTAGLLEQIAPVVRLSKTPAPIRTPPPLLGEHSRDVLLDHGLSAEQVGELVASGVVHVASAAAEHA